MMKRTALLLLAATALLSACNDDSPTAATAAPAGDTGNGGLSVDVVLSSQELALFANADFNQRVALPDFVHRVDGKAPSLAASFGGTADLSGALSSVSDSCVKQELDDDTLYADWACGDAVNGPSVNGFANINATATSIDLTIKGALSSAHIKQVYTSAGGSAGGPAFVISRVSDDSLKVGDDSYSISGNTSIAYESIAFNEVLKVIVTGVLHVSKNGAAPEDITITSSDDLGYVVDSNTQNARFCDGSITYSSAGGLVKTIALPACVFLAL